MRRLTVTAVVLLVVSGACTDVPTSDEATRIFSECMERNGVTFESAEVIIAEDGSVESAGLMGFPDDQQAWVDGLWDTCTAEVFDR